MSVFYYFLPPLCYQFFVLLHFPQILTHQICLLKINFCFWKSEIARLLAITLYFLTQEFKVHTVRFFNNYSKGLKKHGSLRYKS